MEIYDMSTDNHEEENLNPKLSETRTGALHVPENSLPKNKDRKLKPILKFDDFGNEIIENGTN
jgi:hypothetical protein